MTTQPHTSPAELTVHAHVQCNTCCDHAHNHADHPHSDPVHATRDNVFFWPLVWIAAFSLLELAGGIWTHSLALLSDAWHMLADVCALALAMWASRLPAHNPQAVARQRYVAILNALVMLAVTLWMVVEAFHRLQAPRPVAALGMILIAVVGLLVNLWVARHMHLQQHDSHSPHAGHAHASAMNYRAAFLHVLGDLLGSLVAVIAGVVIYITGETRVDPILSWLISALLLFMTLHLLRDIVRGQNDEQQAIASAHAHHHHHDSTHHHPD